MRERVLTCAFFASAWIDARSFFESCDAVGACCAIAGIEPDHCVGKGGYGRRLGECRWREGGNEAGQRGTGAGGCAAGKDSFGWGIKLPWAGHVSHSTTSRVQTRKLRVRNKVHGGDEAGAAKRSADAGRVASYGLAFKRHPECKTHSIAIADQTTTPNEIMHYLPICKIEHLSKMPANNEKPIEENIRLYN
jgi:hypothetical protein